MTKEKIIEKAIKKCNELINKYDRNRDITDLDLCEIIEILEWRTIQGDNVQNYRDYD